MRVRDPKVENLVAMVLSLRYVSCFVAKFLTYMNISTPYPSFLWDDTLCCATYMKAETTVANQGTRLKKSFIDTSPRPTCVRPLDHEVACFYSFKPVASGIRVWIRANEHGCFP